MLIVQIIIYIIIMDQLGYNLIIDSDGNIMIDSDGNIMRTE